MGSIDFSALFSASPNPYVLLDPSLAMVEMNEAYLRVTMRRRDELVGRNMFDAFPSDPDAENGRQLRESFARVLRERDVDHVPLIKYDIPRADGTLEERYWSATHTPLLDAQGELVFILQHTVDVTELHRLRVKARGAASDVFRRARAVQEENRALDEERRHLRRLFEQTPGFMAVLAGPEHVFQLANAAFFRLVGRDDIVGKAVHRALPEVREQGFFELLDSVYRTGEPFVGRGIRVFLQLRSEGAAEEHYVDFVYQPIIDDEGMVSGIFVQGHDITEQKRAERALRDSEARYRALVDAIGRIVWTTRADGQAEEVAQWRAFTGQSAAAVRGWGWLQALHPDDRAPVRETWERAVETGALLDVEYRLRHAEGDYIWYNARGVPVLDERGAVEEWVGVCIDISERKRAEEALRQLNTTLEQRIADAIAERERAEEQLRQAQKMEAVGQLTGGIAHDFNNLLTVISGNLDIALRALRSGNASRLERLLDNAQKGAERAAALTQRLLAFSRRQPLAPRPTDVSKLIAGMADLLTRALGETIRLETVSGAGLWTVEVDQHQLESAILNLAVNARDAMEGGGRLTIEASNGWLDGSEATPGQYVVVTVTDTGTGISKDMLDRVFEPFFTTKGVGKGTGLGLSMVYGFVKQSGGHVQIQSEVGRGTTVEIFLPRLLAGHHEQELRHEAQAVRAGAGETILVVEDDDDVRAYTVETLRDLGYHVLEAVDGAAALRLLLRPETRADLLFTDVVMPEMSGRQLADAARRLLPGLKILYTSGYTRDSIVHDGRLDQGIEMIAKPFTVAAVASKLREMLDLADQSPSAPVTTTP